VQSDGIDFKQLLDAAGRPVDEAFKMRRRDTQLATFRASRPRILMIEMFPFGRRRCASSSCP
jgi:predicted glycosyltransferase